jgi:hypothetical protein
VSSLSRQLQGCSFFVILKDGVIAAVMRCNRGVTTILDSALPDFNPRFVALNIREGAVATERVKIVKPAGTRPVRTCVGNTPPGRVPFGRTNASEIKLPVTVMLSPTSSTTL